MPVQQRLPKGVAREGYVIDHPNRDKASSKVTKAIVVVLLLISAALMVIVFIGGGEALEGAKALHIAYVLVYLVMAFYVARWNRGCLPLAGALAIILLIFALVSAPQWFDRDKAGFNDPVLNENIVGLLNYVLAIVQVLLIGFATRGFQQAWNVEVERPIHGGGHGHDQGQGGHGPPPQQQGWQPA